MSGEDVILRSLSLYHLAQLPVDRHGRPEDTWLSSLFANRQHRVFPPSRFQRLSNHSYADGIRAKASSGFGLSLMLLGRHEGRDNTLRSRVAAHPLILGDLVPEPKTSGHFQVFFVLL
ncbi:unnamed protein product [Protopolystoma xenopodis]|uniref:Uncharacterized protein n=1 Tax=Protopolystoma xenopodis TaxID=117903 RepID=A0A448XQA7_9PLAT|nr:unnamed protein product [Protopolystoma xenopodis]